MYNADDAVARVDSYIVSISGGGRFVGERKLVRIESVDRSAAVASLIGEEGGREDGGAPGEGEEDGVESSTGRRRRRRGGRRRSRARARESSGGESD
jgi:ribonuclease G